VRHHHIPIFHISRPAPDACLEKRPASGQDAGRRAGSRRRRATEGGNEGQSMASRV
jgi:hypothetical protein